MKANSLINMLSKNTYITLIDIEHDKKHQIGNKSIFPNA